jgi:hypothetical protein
MVFLCVKDAIKVAEQIEICLSPGILEKAKKAKQQVNLITCRVLIPPNLRPCHFIELHR